MAKTSEKELAKEMYVRLGKSQKEIADKLGVSAKTMNGWVKTEEWEQLRAAHLSTPSQISKNLQKQLLIISEANTKAADAGEFTPAMADAQLKIASSIQALSENLPLHVQLQVLEGFMNSIPPTDKSVRERVAHYQTIYLLQLAKN